MKPKPSLASLTPLAATLSLLAPTHADSETWSGATNGTWDTSTTNWLTDGSNNLFESADDALFTGTPTNNVTTATGLTIGAITLDGTFTGSVTMSGSNTVSGATAISGGTLNLNNATGLGTGAITVNSGGTLAINPGTANSTVANNISGGGLITAQGPAAAAGNTLQLGGNLSGFTGTLNILAGASNNGKVNFSNTTQTNVMSSGTIQIQSGATLYLNKALNYGASVELFGSGNAENLGALRLESAAVQTGSVTLKANSFIGVNGSAATISGSIGESGGSFGFTKQGNNQLTLTGSNNYTGGTTISGGTLRIGDGGTTGNLGSGSVTNNATLTFNRSNDFTVSNNITSAAGTGIVNKQGAGKLTLSGTNAIGNNLLASAGALEISGATTIDGGAGSNLGFLTVSGNTSLTVSSGGSLEIKGTTHGTKSGTIIGQNAAGTSAVTVSGGTFTVGGNCGFSLGNNVNTAIGTLTISSGTATINAGSATLQNQLNFIALGRDNATGIINLDGGTLETGRQFVRDGSGGGTAGSGTATFNFNGGTLKALANQTSGNGWFETATSGNFQVVTTTVKAGGAKIDTNGFNTNIGTVLEHDSALGATPDGGLTKSGTGTLTLGNASTYTGKTTVTEGTLALGSGGSIANSSEIALNGGNFNVSAVAGFSTGVSQTLSGNGGSVTGDITVNGTFAIGSSPGTMTFNDDLTIGSSAVSNFELTNIGFGAGTFDLAEGGSGLQTVTFGGTLNLFFSGGTYANNSSVQIFNFEGYNGDFTTVNFSGLGVGQSAEFDSSTGFVTVIPEPGAALLGGLGMLALLRRRRD